MRSSFLVVFLACVGLWAQDSKPSLPPSSNPPSSNAKTPDANASKPSNPHPPDLSPPRSDRIEAEALDNSPGESSSKNTQIDLSPPEDDDKAHARSSETLSDAEGAPGNAGISEFHPFDPHKAAKDVEVGDFYFKRKSYHAAEERYREALYYKDNDAIATYRLAICLEKLDRPDEARAEFESYLKILPSGPQAEDAKKAIERLKAPDAKAAK